MDWRNAETGRRILAGRLDEKDCGRVGHVDVVEAIGNRGGCGDVVSRRWEFGWDGRGGCGDVVSRRWEFGWDGRGVLRNGRREERNVSAFTWRCGEGSSRSGEGRSQGSVGKSESGKWWGRQV